MCEVSVIMPTFNRDKYLELTLAAFSAQVYKDFEIIIIDDGSTDKTPEIVERYKKSCNIRYEFHHNHGRSYSRNAALKFVKGRYVIFNDDDRIPAPDFIGKHLDTLKEVPGVVSVGSKKSILSYYSEDLTFRQSYLLKFLERGLVKLEEILEKKDNGPLFAVEELKSDFDRVIEKWFLYEPRDNFKDISGCFGESLKGFNFGWALATTGNMAFEYSGSNALFDEGYVGWGLEDTDFAYQLYKGGYTFRLTPGAANFHQMHKRESGEWDQLKKNIRRFCRKYPSMETYLFAQVFEDVDRRNDFTFTQANEVLKRLQAIDQNDPVYLNYMRLCKLWILTA